MSNEKNERISLALLFEKKWLLYLLLGAGILMLVIGSILPKSTPQDDGRMNVEEYKSSLTAEVTALCERVAGAGRVSLVLHFSGTEEYVYATDKSGNGGKEYVYTSGNGLLLRVDYPAVDGVSVLCEGGDDATVRREMTALLSSLLGIGTNRIHIGKGNFSVPSY